MHKSIRRTVLATGTILAVTGFAAVAAPPAAHDAMPGQAAGTMHAQTAARMPPRAAHTMAATIEQRIADLHARLDVTPDQQPQWDAFAAVMRSYAQESDQRFHQRVQTLVAMTALENMQSYAQLATQHAEDMQKLVPVFQALYNAMSAQQKASADQMFRDRAQHTGQARQG